MGRAERDGHAFAAAALAHNAAVAVMVGALGPTARLGAVRSLVADARRRVGTSNGAVPRVDWQFLGGAISAMEARLAPHARAPDDALLSSIGLLGRIKLGPPDDFERRCAHCNVGHLEMKQCARCRAFTTARPPASSPTGKFTRRRARRRRAAARSCPSLQRAGFFCAWHGMGLAQGSSM